MKYMFIFIIFSSLAEESIPNWISNTSLEDSENFNTVCSGDGETPSEAKKNAENECLTSILKIRGIPVTFNENFKLTQDDLNYEMDLKSEKFSSNIGCKFSDQYIEKNNSVYRVWLKCKILKKSIDAFSINKLKLPKRSIQSDSKEIQTGDDMVELRKLAYLKNLLINKSSKLCKERLLTEFEIVQNSKTYCFNNFYGKIIGICNSFNNICY